MVMVEVYVLHVWTPCVFHVLYFIKYSQALKINQALNYTLVNLSNQINRANSHLELNLSQPLPVNSFLLFTGGQLRWFTVCCSVHLQFPRSSSLMAHTCVMGSSKHLGESITPRVVYI